MTILVTGDKGMIGSKLVAGLLEDGYRVIGVDRAGEDHHEGKYIHFRIDLSDKERLAEIVRNNNVERIIHLAALAHTTGESDLSWEKYKFVNVECAQNVFAVAGNRPLLYISTIDVYGFFDGKDSVNGLSPIKPISKYGKSKAIAERICKKLNHYTIFRLSPVYTDDIKRDIQKRYYLKYPNIAYQIGKGSSYEILNIRNAVHAMVQWCQEEPQNDIRIIKDDTAMWTPDYLKSERQAGRANIILYLPRCIIIAGYSIAKTIFGENEKTYLLNKAVHPLRSE